MAIGVFADLVNAQNLKLGFTDDVTDTNRFFMLQDLDFHVGRPEAREPTTDGGVIYYFGKGDNYFDATLLLTTSQITLIGGTSTIAINGTLAVVFEGNSWFEIQR